MTYNSQASAELAWPLGAGEQRAIHHPLLALLLLFFLLMAGALGALVYLTFAWWPVWADTQDALNAPAIPINVAVVRAIWSKMQPPARQGLCCKVSAAARLSKARN